MGFFAVQKVISKLLNDVIYTIPRNQRKYVWTKDNWNDLYNDVEFSSENKKPHFLGSIVLQKQEPYQGLDTYEIIDGQQRMTTLSIFLMAIMFKFKKEELENDFNGTIKYVQASDDKSEKHMILDSDCYDILKRILDKLTKDSNISEISVSQLINSCCVNNDDKVVSDCFKHFYNLIEDLPNDQIINIKNTILNITYVHIEADTDEDSYTIFEILNARGTELEDSELIKNYIMRYIVPVRNRDKVKHKWEEMENLLKSYFNTFITHYVPHKYSITDVKIKNPYKEIRSKCAIKDIESLLDDIYLKSKYYAKLVNPNDETSECSDLEKMVFSYFKKHRQTQIRPVLLSLMHMKEIENLKAEDYDKILDFLYKFVVCYTVIGKAKSNNIRSVFYKYAPLIENEDCLTNINEFIKSLKDKIPDERWFYNSFSNLGWSNHVGIFKDSKEKTKVQLILELFEKHCGNKNLSDDFTIEHIKPDSEGGDSALVGNLLPLEESLNKKCKNLSLDEKIKYYKQSSYLSTKKFAEMYEKRRKFDLQDRTSRLAKIFYDDILKVESLSKTDV